MSCESGDFWIIIRLHENFSPIFNWWPTQCWCSAHFAIKANFVRIEFFSGTFYVTFHATSTKYDLKVKLILMLLKIKRYHKQVILYSFLQLMKETPFKGCGRIRKVHIFVCFLWEIGASPKVSNSLLKFSDLYFFQPKKWQMVPAYDVTTVGIKHFQLLKEVCSLYNLTWRGIGVTFFCLWIWICVGDLLSGCGDAELLTGTSGGLISSASSEISLFKSKATDLESTDVGSKL